MVSSTQPLANAAGIRILELGGNCVDACVAISACLCVLEPASTGVGGDCFALFFKNSDKKVYGMNGTGRSANKLNIDHLKKHFPDHITDNHRFKSNSFFKVNVPGAIAGWYDAVEKWGSHKISFADILKPAIDLSQNGFVVSSISAHLWESCEEKLLKENSNKGDLKAFLPNEDNTKAPNEGQFMRNENLAKTFKIIAEKGKDGYYKGEISEAIIKELNKRGHVFTTKDFAEHKSTFVEPISYGFLDHKLWEIPPNGSGIIALITLGLIENLEKLGEINLKELKHNSAEYLHLVIECLKIAFKESEEYVFDFDHYIAKNQIDPTNLLPTILSDKYLSERATEFKKNKVINNGDLVVPNPMFKSDTVYFNATDSDGNACSFINSVYESFGSGIIVPDYGFAMHNRGGNFSLNPKAKNCLEGNKRPYHTIIPGMITIPTSDVSKDELYAAYGIMGGYNQPQAHVQVYLNMLLFGMNPQEALDAPRICLSAHPDHKHTDKGFGADGPSSTDFTSVGVEDGIELNVIKQLESLGHSVKIYSGHERKMMGRGQIIRKESKPQDDYLIYAGGSDLRGDGASVPLI
jgi:gamma-glutamyltranspeptidase/glutathione hydrolase